MSVDLQVMHQIVERTMRHGDKNLVGNICLAPRGKRVMELAVDEARLMQHHIIGTEHILLGIIREGEDDVTNVFSQLSIDLLDARAHTLKILTFQKNDADELIASKNLIFVYPPVAAQASSLVPKGMPFLICSRCQARCPDYFHYCFHCGQHFASIE
jgi:ATP-dependent Clp protease ATP-binding subunit ClpA